MTTYDPANVFACIIRGELPCDKVAESEHSLAFRDLHPQAPVHVLVIPKGPHATLADFARDASPAAQADLLATVGQVVEQCGLAAGGYRVLANNGSHGRQEVPHLHFHVLGGGDVGPMLARSE